MRARPVAVFCARREVWSRPPGSRQLGRSLARPRALAAGPMSCCGRNVCVECIRRWRTSYSNYSTVHISRAPTQEKIPDTRACPFCKTIGQHCTSTRRIFSNE